MFVLNIICVSSNESGQGLASKMMNWSENMAKTSGLLIMTAETTGIGSTKLFQKSNFTKVKEIQYDDYIDKNGEFPFANLKPHLGCSIWTKALDLSSFRQPPEPAPRLAGLLLAVRPNDVAGCI